jgi:hypothetical protein
MAARSDHAPVASFFAFARSLSSANAPQQIGVLMDHQSNKLVLTNQLACAIGFS